MSDETEQLPTPEPDAAAGERPRRLLRNRDDRMVAGVAGGLGRYFAVDPLIVRIAFVVSAFIGGIGILAYAALALFAPADPAGDEEPVAPVERSGLLAVAVGVGLVLLAVPAFGSLFFWDAGWGWGGPWGLFALVALGVGVYVFLRDRDPGASGASGGRKVALAALAMLAVIGLLTLAGLSALVAALGGGVAVASILIAAGAMLALAAFRGGARWLIAPAIAIAVPLGIVAAADVTFAGGVGERYLRPASLSELPDRYELGVGHLAVDLTEIDWGETGGATDLELELGAGELEVVVPAGLCVSPDARVGAGELIIGDLRDEGFDVNRDVGSTPLSGPSLRVDAEVDLGVLRIVGDGDASGFDFDGAGRDRERGPVDVC